MQMGIKKKLKIIIHTYELNSLNEKALFMGKLPMENHFKEG